MRDVLRIAAFEEEAKSPKGSEANLASDSYYEGQLQIGVQETHKLRPDFSDDALLELAKAVRGLSNDSPNLKINIYIC